MVILIIIAVFAATFSAWVLIIILKALFEKWLDEDKECYNAPVDADL
jgi:hypothetical protein